MSITFLHIGLWNKLIRLQKISKNLVTVHWSRLHLDADHNDTCQTITSYSFGNSCLQLLNVVCTGTPGC